MRAVGRVTVAFATCRGSPLARSRSTRPRSSSPSFGGVAQTSQSAGSAPGSRAV